MVHEASDWLMRQASASALRLVETPAVLLDPVGRSLRELASHWSARSTELRVVPEATAPSQQKARKPVKKTATAVDSLQPPLMNIIDGSND